MSQVHPSRQSLVPDSKSKPKSKPLPRTKKPNPNPKPQSRTTTTASSSSSSPASVSHLKRKIRDLTRLLSRSTTNTTSENGTATTENASTLPPAAIIQTERALAHYKRDLALLQQASKEKKLNDRYRMVRFFERQKSTRLLKKLQRQSPPPPHDQLCQARLNLNYTIYYPPNQKYISLYRDCSADPKTQRAKEEILQDIKQRMEVGTLGKWTVNVSRETEFLLDDDIMDEEEGGVQLDANGIQEGAEEGYKSIKKRKTDNNDKEGKKHKSKSDKVSKEKVKSESKKNHNDDKPEPAETGGFFEF